MNGWNYRVLKHTDDEESILTIHEVYYEDDKPISWSESEAAPAGGTLEELKHDLDYYIRALDKPILHVKDGKLVED